jgi:hypothetical protein
MLPACWTVPHGSGVIEDVGRIVDTLPVPFALNTTTESNHHSGHAVAREERLASATVHPKHVRAAR